MNARLRNRVNTEITNLTPSIKAEQDRYRATRPDARYPDGRFARKDEGTFLSGVEVTVSPNCYEYQPRGQKAQYGHFIVSEYDDNGVTYRKIDHIEGPLAAETTENWTEIK